MNAPERVEFRAKLLRVQDKLLEAIDSGQIESTLPLLTLKHHFTPKSEYGCHVYAREIFLPKDTVTIGKIHKHAHLNFIMKGRVSVATEFGKREYVAPCVFVSEVGLKRAVYANEDTIWVTVHLTKHGQECDLDKIEDEVIAKEYSELGMPDSVGLLT